MEIAPKAFAKRGGAKNANLPDSIETDDNGTLWIDPDLLKPNPHQPRQIFDESQLKELSDSIAEHGIVQPIVIEDAGDGTFYIIAGERRTRAAKLAGLKKVPVQLRKFNDEKKLEVALIENIQRADLNPIEEAQAYYNLMKIGGLNQDEVAQKVGKGRPTVANALRLLKLPEDMQNSLIVGQITSGHARALLSVVNPADQRVLFGKIIGSNLSVRQAEAQAAAFNDGGRATKKDGKKDGARVRDPDIISIEQKFMETLGTKVSLNGSLEKGQLVIDYFSRADLDRLYQAIIKE
ncbi:MAG: ParB/RepB/Spo0J family partition protein [Treponema sp.]|nr:ParB/RepB/Spo0J family partition protein [Treponema sp.]